MITNNLILLNMFMLVLLQQFELYSNPLNPAFIINQYLKKFRKTYVEFISDKNLTKITENNLIPFLKALNCPLGLFLIFL